MSKQTFKIQLTGPAAADPSRARYPAREKGTPSASPDRTKYIQMAYGLALKGRNTVSPNPMVGAVIVKNGKVIGQGYHHHPGGDHAEIVAIKQAKGDVAGATLYVTLEPCHHFGRTPPCVDEIIKRKFKQVVIGMKDPNPLTNGRSIRKLRQAGIEVVVGVMEQELRILNESFIKQIKTHFPFVVVKVAQTIDGKIACANGHAKWVSSVEARRWSHELRNQFDAIAVGVGTVLNDNPRLNPAEARRVIKKIVFDTRLKTPIHARLFHQTVKGQCLIFTSPLAKSAKIKALQSSGAEVMVAPITKNRIDLKWAMQDLYRRGISRILVEGGGQLIGSFLSQRLVDKMYVVLSPKILGDTQAIPTVAGLIVKNINQCVKLKKVRVEPLGEDFLLQGYL